MKIIFLKPYTDEFGKPYFPGWVADMAQPEAERLIGAGIADNAPEGAYPRKSPVPVFDCAAAPLIGDEFLKTGEEINLEQLTDGEKKASERGSVLAASILRGFKR